MIIRIVQSKGRKDRQVTLPAEILDLLWQWWKVLPRKRDTGVAPEQRWLFPGRTLSVVELKGRNSFPEARRDLPRPQSSRGLSGVPKRPTGGMRS